MTCWALIWLLGLTLMSAQDAQATPANGAEPYLPLKPANMASPRDTLNTFLTEYQKVIDEHFNEGRVTSNQGMAAYDRAISTLDFSNTPDGGSRWVQTEHLVFLKEILDKLALPPSEAIPGIEEVEAAGLSEWRIPDTSITIERAQSGPYQGKWRFSPRTVELLPRYFRQTKELPYQPGATVGLYEAIQANPTGIITREREVGSRLRAANLDSPRSTLEGFMKNMNASYDDVIRVHKALSATPPQMNLDEARALGRRAEDNMQRAVATLDLSGVPGALRYDTGIEAAMLIKEVMDRTTPPPIDQIPNLEQVREIRKAMANEDYPIRWVYPNTSLEIVEVMEGKEKGLFKFSPHTVATAGEAFNSVKDLPYRERHYSHFSAQYESPAISPGFYKFYAMTPGSLIPLATPLGRVVDKLPAFLHEQYRQQALWQWCATALLYFVASLAAILVWVMVRRFRHHCPVPLSTWMSLLPPLLIAVVIHWTTHLITNEVNITGNAILTIITFERVLMTLLIAWALFCLCRAVVETVIALPQIKSESVDASLLRLTSRIAGTMLMLWVVISGLDGLGLDIWPLIAGLGVGGLAVALAFRPTMENIIGSFMIFADKPYKVGQRVKVLGADGTVEAIGLRSTKIRLLSGHLTTIPNEKMASVVIENIGQRPYIRRVFDLTITYDTKPEKINRAVTMVRDILSVPEGWGTTENAEEAKPHPNTPINQPGFAPRVFFNNLNSDSLNILVIYWYHPPEYWDFLEHANWVNVQIMERFAAEDIDFAFPTQTLHLAGDTKHPLTVGQRWESDEEGQSPMHLFSQAAAFGAQSALGNVSFASASDAIKPEPQASKTPKPCPTGDTTDAPIEEGIMDNDDSEANR